MTFQVDYEADILLEFDYDKLIKKVVYECLEYQDCPYECEISVIFTDNEGISKINMEYRSIDAPTDVLSFPMVNYAIPGDFSKLEEEQEDCFNPETGELILGDIVISVDRALQQAEEYGHSVEREVAFLSAHSMFHLFGYDHMEESERIIMEQKQSEVLERLNILR